MRRVQPESNLWKFLDSLGILEKGSDEEIKAAKREYRKKYLLQFKQRQRMKKSEFIICLSKENGEYAFIKSAAKKHHLTPTAFIKQSALAYPKQIYIVPDKLQVARLEQLLADCLNEIKKIASSKERFLWSREQKINDIEKRIEKMENHISETLRNPLLKST